MDACIHTRFREQARRTPARVAVVCGDSHVTYEALDRASDTLAEILRSRRFDLEGRVALQLPRAMEFIVSSLAVLKAGGAYVPIDLSLPKARIDYLIADSAPTRTVTISEHAKQLDDKAGTVTLDSMKSLLEGAREGQGRSPAVVGDNLAYLLYTSGTTGTPKGVQVTHGNVTRLFDAFQRRRPFLDEEIWGQVHSSSFDVSVFEIWGALLHGGRLVMVPEALVRENESLLELLIEQQVSLLSVTPSVFRQLMAAAARRQGSGRSNVRMVIFAGEALDFASLRGIDRLRSKRSITPINMYGITETTVHVTYREVERADILDATQSLIGQPLGDMTITLVNPAGKTMRLGQPGEMLVGGAGVSRGYWQRPAQTAARFVPDAAGQPGARAYASGDIARAHPDGDLEYLGRGDEQVKVHGHRIELGEITSRMASHPDIDDVAVAVHGADSQRQIVAYYVSSRALTAQELRNHAGSFLPAYMIPHVFMQIERIPLTSNGKLDRRRLPPPSADRPDTGNEFAAAADETERALLEIWENTLGVRGIGVHDNFFVLGGDSIKSIQVVAAAQNRGLSLSVAAIFRCGTIRALAEYARSAHLGNAAGAVPPEPFSLLPPATVGSLPLDVLDAFPASRLVQSLIFQSGFNEHYEVYVTTVRLRGPFCEVRFREAIGRQTERNEYLRMSVLLPEDGPPIHAVHRSAPTSLVIADWRHLTPGQAQSDLDKWLLVENRTPFDWSRPPHVRFCIHLLAGEQFQLTVSDVSLDGWAVATLLTELLTDYARLLRDVRADPPVMAVRYASFAALERAALNDREAQEFWLGQIGTGIGSGTQRASGARSNRYGRARIRQEIGPELTNRIRAVSRQLQVPLRSILLASHVHALHSASGDPHVVTGLELNGRPEGRGGDRIIGSFNNIVPYRMDVGDCSWQALVQRVFEHEKRVMPHRRYPYSQLQRLNGGRRLFDTVFVYTDFYIYDELARLEGLELLSIDASDHTYFPLTVHFNMESRKSVINLAADYDAEDFSAAQAESLLGGHLKSLEAL